MRRPREKVGNAVLANGYCKQHQYFAIARLLEELKATEAILGPLEKQGANKEKIREVTS